MDRKFVVRNRSLPALGATRRQVLTIGMALVALVALLGAQLSTVSGASVPAVGGSTISGSVKRDSTDGPGVKGAIVSASASGVTRASLPTGETGSYTVAALPASTYELSVRPTEILTTSPNWVYTNAPLLVTVPDSQTGQNLVVQTASVTVTGKLALPGGATGDFATPGQRAWVRAENQEGQGNTVLVQASGNFKVRALPGLILLRVTLENSDWAVSAQMSGLIYRGEANSTVQVQPNPLPIVAKQATISGKVMLLDGTTAAPLGIPVRAWRLDGSEFEQTTTDSSGLYSINVISGTWALRAVPESDTIYNTQYYVPAQSPMPVRVLSDTAKLTDQNLKIAIADVTVSGSTVPTNAGANGRVYTLYLQDGHPAPGPTAPLTDGAFSSLRLSSSVATTYTFGVYFPPDVPYTALSRVTHNITPGSTLAITIPIALDNSHISGTLRLGSGAPVIGVPGSVWGASNSGGWARSRVDPATGGYDLRVATTDIGDQHGSYWYVHAFVDPTSGYIVRPHTRKVLVPFNDGAGSNVPDQDFTLLQISTLATIHGRVTNPDGTTGLPGVRVAARELAGDSTSAFESGALTDFQGNYSVRVPPGTYRVSAHLGALHSPLPTAPLIAPVPVQVTVGESGDETADLHFRLSDARVRGLVTYDSKTHAALVRARSDDGVVVIVPALPFDHEGSNFVIGLIAGVRWTIEAVASEDSDFLRSNQVVISPTASVNLLGEALVLTKSDTLPDSLGFVFSADQDQLFTLSNGAQVQVPAGSFAISGTVGLIIRPLADLPDGGGARPISFGYRLSAYNATTRLPISHFLRPVTLVIPFTKAQLDALGISSDRLVPAYWDEASASWKPVENVAVIPDGTGGGTVNITVDHFTDFALLGAPGGSIYLPLAMR